MTIKFWVDFPIKLLLGAKYPVSNCWPPTPAKPAVTTRAYSGTNNRFNYSLLQNEINERKLTTLS